MNEDKIRVEFDRLFIIEEWEDPDAIKSDLERFYKFGYQAALATRPDVNKNWGFCPECGCEEFEKGIWHKGNEERICINCSQSWFADIDYSDVIRKYLKDRQALASLPIVQPDVNQELVEALEDIAYAKSYTVQNKPMELVSIALKALAKHKAGEINRKD